MKELLKQYTARLSEAIDDYKKLNYQLLRDNEELRHELENSDTFLENLIDAANPLKDAIDELKKTFELSEKTPLEIILAKAREYASKNKDYEAERETLSSGYQKEQSSRSSAEKLNQVLEEQIREMTEEKDQLFKSQEKLNERYQSALQDHKNILAELEQRMGEGVTLTNNYDLVVAENQRLSQENTTLRQSYSEEREGYKDLKFKLAGKLQLPDDAQDEHILTELERIRAEKDENAEIVSEYESEIKTRDDKIVLLKNKNIALERRIRDISANNYVDNRVKVAIPIDPAPEKSNAIKDNKTGVNDNTPVINDKTNTSDYETPEEEPHDSIEIYRPHWKRWVAGGIAGIVLALGLVIVYGKFKSSVEEKAPEPAPELVRSELGSGQYYENSKDGTAILFSRAAGITFENTIQTTIDGTELYRQVINKEAAGTIKKVYEITQAELKKIYLINDTVLGTLNVSVTIIQNEITNLVDLSFIDRLVELHRGNISQPEDKVAQPRGKEEAEKRPQRIVTISYRSNCGASPSLLLDGFTRPELWSRYICRGLDEEETFGSSGCLKNPEYSSPEKVEEFNNTPGGRIRPFMDGCGSGKYCCPDVRAVTEIKTEMGPGLQQINQETKDDASVDKGGEDKNETEEKNPVKETVKPDVKPEDTKPEIPKLIEPIITPLEPDTRKIDEVLEK